jgi:hypothetical protein
MILIRSFSYTVSIAFMLDFLWNQTSTSVQKNRLSDPLRSLEEQEEVYRKYWQEALGKETT